MQFVDYMETSTVLPTYNSKILLVCDLYFKVNYYSDGSEWSPHID